MEIKNKVPIKKAAVKMVTKSFDICDDIDCHVVSSHIHLKGAITLVKDNELHTIEMKVPEMLVI